MGRWVCECGWSVAWAGGRQRASSDPYPGLVDRWQGNILPAVEVGGEELHRIWRHRVGAGHGAFYSPDGEAGSFGVNALEHAGFGSSEAVTVGDGLGIPLYGSRHPTESYGWENLLDLGNPGLVDTAIVRKWRARVMVVAADSVQMDPQALARVEQLFKEQIEKGLHPGAGLAVYRHGKPVLDLYGGLADQISGKPVSSETMFVLFSATKPLAAACLHILWQQGRLAWDDSVASYWAEFGQHGKDGITVRHLLTHQGGFHDTPVELTWDKWRDWNTVIRAMEGITPTHAPGSVIAYHARNFGWVIGELVQRIDGRPFSQFLREELTAPLGMAATYVGLPPELEGRVSTIHAMEDADRPEMATDYSRPEVHQAVHPAGTGIAPARDLARFYAMLEGGGTLDRVQIFTPETVAEVTGEQVGGTDIALGQNVRRSLGMALGDQRMGTDDIRTFGHGGAGTSLGWADPVSGLAFAYITNGFRADATNVPRLTAMSRVVREACR